MDAAAFFGQDGFDDGKAEAGTGFGRGRAGARNGIGALENVFKGFGGDTDTVVGNSYDSKVAVDFA